MNIEINFIAVLLAAIASMVLGFVWYSPMVLGKPWMKERGYTKESLNKEQKEMGKWYAVSFVLALVTAYVLAHVMGLSMYFYNNSPVTTGLLTGFWVWLGFVMTVQATATIFSDKKNWKLFGIDSGYQLVSLLLMGVVLGLLS